MKRRLLAERFWSKVTKGDGCWDWTASLNDGGYGRFGYEGRTCLAHRVSWVLEHGGEMPELWVLHHCDNPRCVRPDHLFLGTDADNQRDKNEKGRGARGEGLHNILTELDVLFIRRRYEGGDRQVDLARHFDVNPGVVNAVLSGRSWGHVTGGGDIRRKSRWRGRELTIGHVREIRFRSNRGEKQSELAKDYSVNQSTISLIVTRKRWAHI